MAVIFNAFYRVIKNGSQQTVPAPVDPDTPHAPWWTDRIASMARGLAQTGFTDVLWPPFTMSQGGAANNADGYGKFNDYDLGRWMPNHKRFNRTRWGNIEQLRRALAVVKAAGMNNLGDMVIHQYNGGNNRTYKYPGADGKILNGRFPKTPSSFVGGPGGVAVDRVFNPEGNQAFGDMVSYQNSRPAGYMLKGLTDAIRWQVRTLGLDGFRIDDTKGEATGVVNSILKNIGVPGLFTFGECFTGDTNELERWLNAVDGADATLDFQMHFILQAVADGNASCRLLDGGGLVGRDPARSVTFVDTADTDGADSQRIRTNKLLCYAYLLSIPGVPLVYAKDYLEEQFCYGLRHWIDNLVWINRMFAFGGCVTRYVDDKVIVINRDGNGGRYGWSGGLLTALNFDTWNARQVTCQTSFGPNRHLHDYTGHIGDVWTDWEGKVTFTIPSNAYSAGQSYVCLSPAGVNQPVFTTAQRITQRFYGADDLDIAPLQQGANLIPCRIHASGSPKMRITPGVGATPSAKPSASAAGTAWLDITIEKTSPGTEDFTLDVNYMAAKP
jgi:alpha-amylase